MDNQESKPAPRASWIALRLAGLLVAAVALVGAAPGGCEPANDSAFGEPSATATTDVGQRLLDAQAALANHDVSQAQLIYAQIVAGEPDPPGDAHAGKAICDLLLLPGSPEFGGLLVDQLGATSGLDANDAIYADQGYLYWLVRGVPWADQRDDYAGIQRLIADDLPWSAERLSTLRAFFTGLSAPTNQTMDQMVQIADAMAQIGQELDAALADSTFEVMYIPGQTFHYDELELLVGRSELHALASMVAAARGLVYFAAAYQHDYTLDELLGAQTQQRDDPRDGWTTVDYAVEFVDGRLLREVRDPSRLRKARNAFNASLSSAIDAIESGIDQSNETTLRWGEADPAYADDLVAFLEAVKQALYGRTALPGTTPATTLDLSSFFVGGRTLDADKRWFVRRQADSQNPVNAGEGDHEWVLRDGATQAFMVDGVFEPGFDVADGGPDLAVDNERGDTFVQTVSGPVENDIKDAYFTTQ